jgi:hypothetical protein
MKNTNIIINYSYYNTSNINIHTTNSLQLTAAYQAESNNITDLIEAIFYRLPKSGANFSSGSTEFYV